MTVIRRIWQMLCTPVVVALGITLLAYVLGGLRPVQHHLHDLQASLTRHTVPSDLVIIEIDSSSLQQLNTWPWPRRYHAQLLEKLHQAGVKDVFYDVDFSSASNPVDDQLLVQAAGLFERDRLMFAAFIQPSHNLGDSLVASIPFPALRQNGVLAAVNMHPDSDGLIRRVSGTWPLGAETAILAGIRMQSGYTGRDAFQIDYSIEPGSFTRVSFKDVLGGTFDPAQLKNKHIIVGATAIELGDMLPVPVYRSLPGAVVQALAYQTLVEGVPTATPAALNWVGFAILSICLALLFRFANWKQALLAVAAGGSALFATSVYLFWEWRWVLPTAAPMMLMTAGYGIFLISRIEQQHLRLLVQAFDLRRKDALMASVVDGSLDAIITMSDRGLIQSANPAALELFGRTPEQLKGKPITAFVRGLDTVFANGFLDARAEVDRDRPIERQASRRDGSLFPVEMLFNRIVFGNEVVLTLFIRDITERHAQRSALEHQATHDALTGLANRYRLNARLDAIESGDDHSHPRTALLLIDLDKFKEINDTLGHAVGDQILVQIAQRFAGCLQDDMLLTRLGGDEFSVLLPVPHGVDDATRLAASLGDALKAPFLVGEIALEIGASIGIALYPDHADTGHQLLQHADTAMYHAKRSNTGAAIYMPELTERNAERMTISTGLRQAMAESRLSMHYQPKLSLATGAVESVEALLRWTHPQLGFIAPDKIIDVAESTGLIWPLTEWTLVRAIRDSQAWLAQGHRVSVAVNLSARLLQDVGLVDRIGHCLDTCSADPKWLQLEITESAIMSDPDRAMKNAQALQRIGIELAIDDFGTGYSSLSYLRNLPAQELKIDKSFVMEMLNRQNDRMIVESTIKLAHALGLKVVAEGIESAAMLEALRELGCDIAQGYHISRPIPPDQLEKWLRQWTRDHVAPVAASPVAARVAY